MHWHFLSFKWAQLVLLKWPRKTQTGRLVVRWGWNLWVGPSPDSFREPSTSIGSTSSNHEYFKTSSKQTKVWLSGKNSDTPRLWVSDTTWDVFWLLQQLQKKFIFRKISTITKDLALIRLRKTFVKTFVLCFQCPNWFWQDCDLRACHDTSVDVFSKRWLPHGLHSTGQSTLLWKGFAHQTFFFTLKLFKAVFELLR